MQFCACECYGSIIHTIELGALPWNLGQRMTKNFTCGSSTSGSCFFQTIYLHSIDLMDTYRFLGTISLPWAIRLTVRNTESQGTRPTKSSLAYWLTDIYICCQISYKVKHWKWPIWILLIEKHTQVMQYDGIYKFTIVKLKYCRKLRTPAT